jgi:hypothetical protein
VPMAKTKTPLLGYAFNDVLNELHQIVFEGIPDETAPFELSQLEREYIAYLLAVYYDCEHCREYHGRVIGRLRRQPDLPDWDWKNELVSATLFLHMDGRKLSDIEWEHWITTWRAFAKRLDIRHPMLSAYLAYAVGIARKDSKLMNCAFDNISAGIDNNDRLKGVIRDIDGVVIFMKAATSKNRSDAIILAQLASRGIHDGG